MQEGFLLASVARSRWPSGRTSEPTKDLIKSTSGSGECPTTAGRPQGSKPLLNSTARRIFIFFDYLKAALIFIVAILLIYYLVVQIFFIKGASMDPNFAGGEIILVDRFSYYFVSPKRGDSIVFVFPGTKSDKYIKRIIGLPGERIQIAQNLIKIDGKKLEEDYIPFNIMTSGEIDYKLKDDEYFVLGDNRELSNDSRIWGALLKSQIIGKAQYIFYPFDKSRWLERKSYNI